LKRNFQRTPKADLASLANAYAHAHDFRRLDFFGQNRGSNEKNKGAKNKKD